MILTHRDWSWPPADEERYAGRAGCPDKNRDEARRAAKANPAGAGRFWPTAALLVVHDAIASLTPRALQATKIDSVTVGQYHVITL
jgi:hypothetical protein